MKIIPRHLLVALFILNFSSLSFGQDLPTGTSIIFSGSGNCQLCHELVSPNVNALRDINGNDIAKRTRRGSGSYLFTC